MITVGSKGKKSPNKIPLSKCLMISKGYIEGRGFFIYTYDLLFGDWFLYI